jgi:uncharacterized membrane protein
MGVGGVRERQLDVMIGTILRVGVAIAATLVSAGLIMMEVGHTAGRADIGAHTPVLQHLPSLATLLHAAFVNGNPPAMITLGIIALLLTPVVRVAASMFVFLYENDRRFVYFTLTVLLVLIFGLSGGR